jgi:hypothetical protein
VTNSASRETVIANSKSTAFDLDLNTHLPVRMAYRRGLDPLSLQRQHEHPRGGASRDAKRPDRSQPIEIGILPFVVGRAKHGQIGGAGRRLRFSKGSSFASFLS